MKAIKAYTQIYVDFDGQELLNKIEMVARTCYKSESKIKEGSAEKMVASLIKSGHEAMLEHASVTVKFVCDRGVSHELVRHRLASFAQESTRYCNYSKNEFGSEITFIIPYFMSFGTKSFQIWKNHMVQAENAYFDLLDFGLSPQEARSVLPNSLKTEVNMTCNLREWRHFFKLRAAAVTGLPHPQMLEVAVPLLESMKELIPVVFDDIEPCEQGKIFIQKKEDTKRHLCDSCTKHIATCDGDPEFGDGLWNDNVFRCSGYVKGDENETY